MSIPSASVVRLVEQAVELRLAGFSWDAVAARVGRPAGEVRRWPVRYRAAWDAAEARGRHERLAAAGDEALNVLRQMLRSDKEDIRTDAAKKLVDRARAAAPDAEPVPASELVQIAAYLETLTHDQRRQLLARELARHAGPAAFAAGRPDGGPGA